MCGVRQPLILKSSKNNWKVTKTCAYNIALTLDFEINIVGHFIILNVKQVFFFLHRSISCMKHWKSKTNAGCLQKIQTLKRVGWEFWTWGLISKLVSARFMRDFEQLAFNWERLICQQWLNSTLVHWTVQCSLISNIILPTQTFTDSLAL